MSSEKQLIDMFESVIEGTGKKEDLCDLIEDQVFGLVRPVIKKEKEVENVVLEILLEICKSVEDFNLNKNIRRQIAVLTSVYLYGYLVEQGEQLQTKGELLEYEYFKVKDDKELYPQVKELAKAFKAQKGYKKNKRKLKKLKPLDIVFLELYGYEMNSIDQLEDLLEVDSSFLCNEIARIKCVLLGVELESIENDDIEAVGNKRPLGKIDGFIAKLLPKLDKKYYAAVKYGVAALLTACFIFIIVSVVHNVSASKKDEPESTAAVTTQQETTAEATKKATTKADDEVVETKGNVEYTQEQTEETVEESTENLGEEETTAQEGSIEEASTEETSKEQESEQGSLEDGSKGDSSVPMEGASSQDNTSSTEATTVATEASTAATEASTESTSTSSADAANKPAVAQ